jgi:hypothetical protein
MQIVPIIGCLALVLAKVVAQDPPLLIFNGRVINDLGDPMEGAQVQFWHTDENGNYDHPAFNTGGVALVPDFQYFGTATTAADGSFQFRTIRPGIYSARPITHIHYKVWWNGNDVLTSQFYFLDEGSSQPPLLQLALIEQDDGSFLTNKTISLNMGLGGSELITPSQSAGPFYPVVDFFNLDSELTVVTPEEQGTPSPTQTPQEQDTPATTSQQAPSDAIAGTSTATALPTTASDPDALNSSTASSVSLEIRALLLLSALLVLRLVPV